MEMEEIDVTQAYTLEPGDYIMFDNSLCEVKEVIDPNDESGVITIISEDDRERREFWFTPVQVFGYPA